jgi:hypothetical protein
MENKNHKFRIQSLLKLIAGKDEMYISWEENNMHTEAIDLSFRGQ